MRSRVTPFPPSVEPRRHHRDGRALHCCTVCHCLKPWDRDWSWYGSYAEFEDGFPVQKFCSETCKKHQKAITVEMCDDARRLEHAP